MDEVKNTTHAEQEWKNRVLCSDESCIGVIGPDGRCKECGLAYNGPLPQAFQTDAGVADIEGVAEDDDLDLADDADSDAADDSEWARRQLCSDENCIGVIGPDGRCKECGRPSES